MSLFLPGTIGFQRLWATTLGSRSAAADRLAIIARNARPDAPAAYSYACTRLPLSQVLLAPRTSAFVYNGNQWALPPPNSFRALKTRGPIFGEPHVRSIEIGRRATGRNKYFPKVIEPTLRSRARRLPGWPLRLRLSGRICFHCFSLLFRQGVQRPRTACELHLRRSGSFRSSFPVRRLCLRFLRLWPIAS